MKPERRDFDQPLKEMLAAAHDGFMKLIGIEDAVWQAEVNTEITSPPFSSDVVWRVTVHDQPMILHIELQTKADGEMSRRLANYAMRLWWREKEPVCSFVVYLKPTEVIPASPFVINLPNGDPMFQFYFRTVRLWELDPQFVLSSEYPELWPLATLMAGADEPRAFALAQRIATAPLPREQRTKLESLVVLFAGLRLKVQQLHQLVESDAMLSDIFKESSLRELLLREVDKEKVEASRQEGIEQGELNMLRQILSEFAERQFGALSEVTRQAIQACGVKDTLNQALMQLGTFADEAALRDYLSAPAA